MKIILRLSNQNTRHISSIINNSAKIFLFPFRSKLSPFISMSSSVNSLNNYSTFNVISNQSLSCGLPSSTDPSTLPGFVKISNRTSMTLWDSSPKSSEYEEQLWPKELDEIPSWKLAWRGFKRIPRECMKWWREKFETLVIDKQHLLERYHGDYEVVWQMNSEKSLEQWKVTADSDIQLGFSKGSIKINEFGHGEFSGSVCTRLIGDGVSKKAGFVQLRSPLNIISFVRQKPYDFRRYNCILIRCRGDGRQYGFTIQTDWRADLLYHDQHNWMLFTRGGPYWQLAKIPLNKCYLAHKGRIQDKQGPVPDDPILSHVKWIGLTIADKNDGPFKLEIDWIGFCYDANMKTDFDYEQFYFSGKEWGALSSTSSY